MTIHARLRKLRKRNGFTQQYVAEILNMSQNAYSLLETGKTKLDIERLSALANLYQISVQEIVDPSLFYQKVDPPIPNAKKT